MKLIEAMIRLLNLEEVEIALQDMGIEEIGIEEIMVSQSVSNGLKKGKSLLYRGAEYIRGKVFWKVWELVDFILHAFYSEDNMTQESAFI